MSHLDFGTKLLKEKSTPNINLELDLSKTKRTYGVSLIFNENDTTKLQIHYLIDVMCIESNNNQDYIFEIFKHQIFLNEQKPSSTLGELNDRCGKVIYPLKVKISTTGQVLEIINCDDINKRWQKEANEVRRRYSGKVTDNILKSMTSVLNRPDYLLKSLKEDDWFYSVFFFNPYSDSIHTGKPVSVSYPIFPFEIPLDYLVTDSLKVQPKREQNKMISRLGSLKEVVDYKNYKIMSGNVDLRYYYYPNTPMVDAIIGTCNATLDSGLTKEVKIEIYNQKRKTPETAADKQAMESKEDKEVSDKIKSKKKKKWFSIFR